MNVFFIFYFISFYFILFYITFFLLFLLSQPSDAQPFKVGACVHFWLKNLRAEKCGITDVYPQLHVILQHGTMERRASLSDTWMCVSAACDGRLTCRCNLALARRAFGPVQGKVLPKQLVNEPREDMRPLTTRQVKVSKPKMCARGGE